MDLGSITNKSLLSYQDQGEGVRLSVCPSRYRIHGTGPWFQYLVLGGLGIPIKVYGMWFRVWGQGLRIPVLGEADTLQ